MEVDYRPADCWMQTWFLCSTYHWENKAEYKPFYPKNVPLSFLSLTESIVNLPVGETLRQDTGVYRYFLHFRNILGDPNNHSKMKSCMADSSSGRYSQGHLCLNRFSVSHMNDRESTTAISGTCQGIVLDIHSNIGEEDHTVNLTTDAKIEVKL